MGMEEVKSDILSQAEIEAKKILEAAESEAKDIKNSAREEVQQYKIDAESHSSVLFERTRRKMLAAAQFDAQRKILNTKQEAIDNVLKSVRNSIVTMKDSERKKFLSMLLLSAKKEITVAKVYANKKDLKAFSGVTVTSTDIDAGLIAENKDGSISVDLSIDTLLEHARNEHLIELSEALFQ